MSDSDEGKLRLRVSIGLPVYNGEQYLAQAVDSILAQDFTDFELMIVDNASTDRSVEIATKYAAADPRVKVYRSEKNRGAAWNFNRCVSLANGYYFKWMAHDDQLDPRWLSECVNVMEERPDVVICYPRTLEIDSTGDVIRELPSWCPQGASPARRAGEVLTSHGNCRAMFGLVRLHQLVQTELIGSYRGSDRVLLVQLALMGSFYELREFLFRNRTHEGRSGGALRDRRVRRAFLDPTKNTRWLMPRWRVLGGYIQGFLSAPVPVSDRLAALRLLPRWVVRNRGYLVKDIVQLSRPVSFDSRESMRS